MTGKVVYSSDGWFEFHATDEFLFFYYYFELIPDRFDMINCELPRDPIRK